MDEQPGRARSPSAPPPDTLLGMCAAHGHVYSGGRFPSGTVFGDWRLTAFIGRGGNGEVYCAEHVTLGTPAAVKVLMREDERAKARFTREAKLLAKLKSTAFPRFYAYGEVNGTAFLAMELLEPGDLPTDDGGISQFLLKVCDAVAELHALGYVHRDIKPANILWRTGTTGASPVAVPVLADLGLVKDVTAPDAGYPESSVTLGGVGTPGYGAPEQMERGEATVASDIHALGVLADRCFNGKPPRAWARIIQRATSSIPTQRYSSVTKFSNAIHRRHYGWYAVTACVIASVVVTMIWICMSFMDENLPKSKDSAQDIHEVRDEIQVIRIEKFEDEISKGWAEMIKELRKFCELGVWRREMIGRHKDFWGTKGNLNHQNDKLRLSKLKELKENVGSLIQDWKTAKDRHDEKIRMWNRESKKLGLSVLTPPEEYSRLRKTAEDILENRLIIDYNQL